MYLPWLYIGELVLDEHSEQGIVKAERRSVAQRRSSAVFELAGLGEFVQDTEFSKRSPRCGLRYHLVV
ncbi:hypothetical protein Tdes44962_MAKER04750 [Teratosphaeria destructans]|uniref:Uncharacterized protein n=1 Tax=Teratosphaeria destructans TaxID=418781 RepID=A0A9W7SM38_9PEZI|nr:hypothetical protein Tdes44962_MAKER04750 [Teratosphaeria destructans]